MTVNTNYKFLALLRGINVGGNTKIKMSELSLVLKESGLKNIETYIQSGNVIFTSAIFDTEKLAAIIHDAIQNKLGFNIGVVVLTKIEWSKIIKNAPAWWGSDPNWKHNLLVLLKPYDMQKTIESIGKLKPEIENIEPGEGVLYQSMSIKLFGRTTTGKLASSPIYKKMTIRNFNTAHKLLDIIDKN